MLWALSCAAHWQRHCWALQLQPRVQLCAEPRPPLLPCCRYNRDKLDTLVHFPLQDLDLSRYVLTQQGVPPTYDLFAISNHFGGMGGGHYTGYAQVGGARQGVLAAEA